MPFRCKLPPSWWWYDTIEVEAWQVEAMVKHQHPDCYSWLISQCRHDWWFEWRDINDTEKTMLVTVWVTFLDMADAALFRIFFCDPEVP